MKTTTATRTRSQMKAHLAIAEVTAVQNNIGGGITGYTATWAAAGSLELRVATFTGRGDKRAAAQAWLAAQI